MARRDLSRTVIEGGRHRQNKKERRASHGRMRARERAWLDDVELDFDFDESRALGKRPKVNRSFDDKLAVPTRWLRKQCGRPWNDVFSELMGRFDPRSVAGQHIVFDHMLRDVRRAPDANPWSTPPFEVDDDGILRALPTWRQLRRKPRAPVWTDHRWAVMRDGRWWWVGDHIVGPCVQLEACRYHHLNRGGVPHHYTRATLLGRLTPTEVGRLTSLPARVREVVLWRGALVRPDAAPLARP